ncbi:MAG: hypothetical protein A2137_04105 [Chloroflexi bacterium RBG_16_58_8]|nr:MAG: hypothetical protein A2137_04105 [Chloroflexi bacterium RBG_16_58_8]
MTIFVGVLLILLTFALIVYPFYRRLRPAVSRKNERLQELSSKRDTSYSMLKELEFDRASGILTEEDYRDLEGRYKKKAINVLKEMDNVEKGSPVEDEIERQVKRLRQKQAGGVADDEIERQVKQVRNRRQAVAGGPAAKQRNQPPPQGQRRFCRQCGARAGEQDRYCAACGTQLN